jgi:endonuclease/exonuclease/phosphatase family metal-dependent hydrolase
MALRILLSVFLFSALVTGLMGQELKVMSYNIHHGRNSSGQIDLNAIAEVIKSSGAEVVGLQEVDSVCRRSGNVDQMKVLGKLTGMHYAFKKHFNYGGGSYGLGILSKFPISQVYEQRITSFSDKEDEDKTLVLLSADIPVRSAKTIHFATVHFDYRKDPAVRLAQSSEVAECLSNINYPVVLTGDLNAEPDKLEIRNLYKAFTDTDTSGAFTFPADQPVKKIDYILISTPDLKKVVGHQVIDEPVASDHRPVSATVLLKK